MLYSKPGIFTSSLTTGCKTFGVQNFHVQSSNMFTDSTAPDTERNFKKHHEFVLSSRSELTSNSLNVKRNAFLLCPTCAFHPYSHLFKKISFKRAVMFCDRVFQLNSKLIVVVKGNPKHPLKAIRNVQSSTSPLAIKTKLHSERKWAIFKANKCLFHQQHFYL